MLFELLLSQPILGINFIFFQVGRTYLHELGRKEFRWVIQNFTDLLLLGDTIRSPSIKIQTLDPSNRSRIETFHFEMNISNPHTMPINLVKESFGPLLVKIDLLDYKPTEIKKNSLKLVQSSPILKIDKSVHVLTLSTDGKFPASSINEYINIFLVLSLRQKVEKVVNTTQLLFFTAFKLNLCMKWRMTQNVF